MLDNYVLQHNFGLLSDCWSIFHKTNIFFQGRQIFFTSEAGKDKKGADRDKGRSAP